MASTWLQNPLMKAIRREPALWTPIWLMRQAGRYLPEYRRLRESVSFLDLCKTPDLAAETTVRTVERLGVDAAIVFSDLLLILEPMGMTLEYSNHKGPVLQNPIHEPADVERLGELETIEPLHFVMEAVQKSRAALSENVPLIGFAGAPFTLAAYVIEGGSSRDYRRTKSWMYNDTGAWDALMGRLARAITLYVNAQIDAGCQVVQLFDSWVGCLSPEDYHSYVLPHTRSVIESIQPDTPVIHFATGNPALLPLLSEAFGKKSPRPAAVGVDWRIRLDDAWRAIGHDKAIQGNLDPAVLLTTSIEIRRRVKELLHQAAYRPGHIFNLGHGVLPQTPVENVRTLVEAVHEFSGR